MNDIVIDNLRVCAHCLAAIQSREGYQPTVPIFVDEDDASALTCDWCDESGFDTLFEFI